MKTKKNKKTSTPDATGVFRPPSRLPRRPPPATDASLFRTSTRSNMEQHGLMDVDKSPENEARLLRNQKRVDSRAALLVDGWSLLCDLGCAKGALKGWRGEAFGQPCLSAWKYGVSFGGTEGTLGLHLPLQIHAAFQLTHSLSSQALYVSQQL